jgi:hypothetical protein
LGTAEIAIEAFPEMEPFDSRSELRSARSAENPEPAGVEDSFLQGLLQQLASVEPRIRNIDLQSISRWSVPEMEGYVLPEGFVADLRLVGSIRRGNGDLVLEFQGPRLPSNYDIVFRHLHLFVTVEGNSGTIQKVDATIQIYREE